MLWCMLETSARLLRLLSLLQSTREWSGAILAERLEVSQRTVRRDVDRLRHLGYPVHAVAGIAGYRLGAGANVPPLLLDDDEAVAVAVGLRTAAGGSVAGIEETSLRALAKLEQVLPPRLRHRVRALQAAVVPMVDHVSTVDGEVLSTLAALCQDHERLRFDYRGQDGISTVRLVEPHRLVHSRRRWYLVAWDLDRDDWRTFRVDLLDAKRNTGPRFVPRDLPDEKVAALTSWGVSTGAYRYQARLTMHAAAAVVAERISPTSGLIEPVDDHTCILHAGSNSLDELAVYVALIGVDFDVHDPPELLEHLRALSERLNRAAW